MNDLPPPDLMALQRALTAQLLQAGRHWRRCAERELESYGISEACAAPLLWAGRLGGGVRQVTLASHVGIEGPSLVRLLDQLAVADLIERRDDPTDRRAKTIWLTPAGDALAARIEDMLVGVRARVLAGFDHADLEAALRVLKAFDETSVRSPEEALP
ncbi:MarR family transcriptional regulator for hemolysin [Angulomicrobium tetraedrale]|uniref:MarR family transcriptional regulator for hemolysin n=1 Tax=Ancylobacter tetraedralis TaxID=217068 RepID=A0A839ZGH6_9HYPH|nr:MarR family transcriptional regulator [Ancylobacter tetraedralis]MBB3773697.1 MarR family transcriptional regulator for hemolysin [Ancylobacter tetraedralis]